MTESLCHAPMGLFTFCEMTAQCHIFGLGVKTKVGAMTLKFELWQDFCMMHLTTKFHHPMFNHSELSCWPKTNKSTNKWMLLTTSTLLCYAMLVEKYNITIASIVQLCVCVVSAKANQQFLWTQTKVL